MTYDFRPAKRENVWILIGVAGGTGSGKTYSGLRTASGIAAGHPFAGIDTENGRMNHYADQFPLLRVTQIVAPFRPDSYTSAIEAGAAYLASQNVPPANRVVLVDSMSHEWAGDGGCLDWHDELMGGDPKKNLAAWIEPKKQHKRMVTRLLQIDAHVILCFRAEPKVEVVAGNKIVPKQAPQAGLDGWIPITEKNLPYEMTASFLLMADAPGVPKPIKLQEQHKPLVPLTEPLGEETGRLLGEWARGDKVSAPGGAPAPASPTPGDGPATGAEQSLFAPPASAVELAGQAHPPLGVHGITDAQAAYTLAGILETGDRGVEFLKWAAQQTWPDEFQANLDVFMQAHLPAVPA